MKPPLVPFLLFASGCRTRLASEIAGGDKSPHCKAWAAQNECQANPEYMLEECADSCQAQSSDGSDEPTLLSRRATPADEPQTMSEVHKIMQQEMDVCPGIVEECEQTLSDLRSSHHNSLEELKQRHGEREQHQSTRTASVVDRASRAKELLVECWNSKANNRDVVMRRAMNVYRLELNDAKEDIAYWKRAMETSEKAEVREAATARKYFERARLAEQQLREVTRTATPSATSRSAKEIGKALQAAEQHSTELHDRHQRYVKEAFEQEADLLEKLEATQARIQEMEELAALQEKQLQEAVDALTFGSVPTLSASDSKSVASETASLNASAAPRGVGDLRRLLASLQGRSCNGGQLDSIACLQELAAAPLADELQFSDRQTEDTNERPAWLELVASLVVGAGASAGAAALALFSFSRDAGASGET